jgi:cytochrome oxidase assembly protein ShyY1
MVFSLGKKIKGQWQLSLLFLLFLPLLLRLGFWQLERAEEKQQLLTVYQQQRELPVKKFNARHPQNISHYQTVELVGEYEKNRYWLLDNMPRNGKVGYEIVMPLKVGEHWVLVNRGWVLAPRLRAELPMIETPTGSVTIEGYFYQASKNAIFNNIESDLKQDWPKRVLQLDDSHIQAALGGKVYPQMLRIDEESEGALMTQWPVINTLPEKHQGYAVQWFAMALALVCLYAWVLLKENNKESGNE